MNANLLSDLDKSFGRRSLAFIREYSCSFVAENILLIKIEMERASRSSIFLLDPRLFIGTIMTVHIPSPLLSYTNQQNDIDADGSTVAEMLDDLNRQFPGIRFRMIDEQDSIRPHMKIFVNGEQVWRLDTALKSSDEVYILQALSGG